MVTVIHKKATFGLSSFIPNTFIGGVGSSITSAAQLASTLGISTSIIAGFRVLDNEVQALITQSYSMNGYTFRDNDDITYFYDNDGLVTFIGSQTFRRAGALTEVVLPNCVEIESYQFENSPNLTLIDIPNCTIFGNSPADHNTIISQGLNANLVINAHIFNMTSNDGRPEASLVHFNYLVNYVGYVDDGSWNTEIQGDTTYNTRLSLGAATTANAGAILNVHEVNGNIRFKCIDRYAFNNDFMNNSALTGYVDNDGFVAAIIDNCFQNTDNMTELNLPGIINLGSGGNDFGRYSANYETINMPNLVTFGASYFLRDGGKEKVFNLDSLESVTSSFYGVEIAEFNAKKLKNIGSDTTNNDRFTAMQGAAPIFRVHEFLATNNAGGPDGDLVAIVTSKNATVEFYDDNGDYVSTLTIE